MYPVDRHRKAVEWANECTYSKFKVHSPYEPGTEANAFWLNAYDAYIRSH